MRIALNATVFKNALSGVGKRTACLVRHGAALHPEHQWFFFSPGPLKRPNLPGVDATWVEGKGGSESRWQHKTLPGLLAEYRIDVLEAPWGGGLPGGKAKPCPYVTTFHDTLPLDRHTWWGERLRYKLKAGADIHRADGIIAVSEDTKSRLGRHFPASIGKTTVIPNGVEPGLVPPTPGDLQAFRQGTLTPHSIGPYLLYVGGFNARKNVENLVRAFAVLLGDGKTAPAGLKLVLAGHTNPYFEKKIRPLIRALGLAGRTALPGFLKEDEMALWYGAAVGACYPSLHEGFGMPVLEAMACGVPVLTHHDGPMLEFAHGVAVTADGRRVGPMVQALGHMVRGEKPSREALAHGVDRARAFHWSPLAEQYLTLLSSVVRRG